MNRYIAANTLIYPESSLLMERVVSRGLDAEAVELALRLRRGPTVLTRKIQILFYLLEVRSAYHSFFFGGAESRPRAFLGLANAVFKTGMKYVKGAYLLRKHGLI